MDLYSIDLFSRYNRKFMNIRVEMVLINRRVLIILDELKDKRYGFFFDVKSMWVIRVFIGGFEGRGLKLESWLCEV